MASNLGYISSPFISVSLDFDLTAGGLPADRNLRREKIVLASLRIELNCLTHSFMLKGENDRRFPALKTITIYFYHI